MSKFNVVEVDGLKLWRPTRAEVESLAVGDEVLDCFGNLRRVVDIHARRDDVSGKLFACFYQDFGNGSTISGSIKEGEPVMTVPACDKYKRSENYPV